MSQLHDTSCICLPNLRPQLLAPEIEVQHIHQSGMHLEGVYISCNQVRMRVGACSNAAPTWEPEA